jgi:hypothetical protein
MKYPVSINSPRIVTDATDIHGFIAALVYPR